MSSHKLEIKCFCCCAQKEYLIMNKLYERILSLCEQRKIKPGRMCGAIGVSRGNITDLKMGRIESLSAETLSKIS